MIDLPRKRFCGENTPDIIHNRNSGYFTHNYSECTFHWPIDLKTKLLQHRSGYIYIEYIYIYIEYIYIEYIYIYVIIIYIYIYT